MKPASSPRRIARPFDLVAGDLGPFDGGQFKQLFAYAKVQARADDDALEFCPPRWRGRGFVGH